MRAAWLAVVCLVGGFAACGTSGGGSGSGGTGASGGGGSSGTGTGGSAGSAQDGSAGSATGGTAGGATGGSAGSATGGSGGGQGGSGQGGSSGADADLPDVTFVYDAGIEDSSVGQDSACAATSVKAELAPLDMYVMLDKSGSMGSDCVVPSTGTSKWCYAVNALYNFFSLPASSGTGVALQYFPISGYQCTGNGGTCATPAVGLGLLPALLPSLQTSLTNEVPNGSNTPTEAGIRGLVDFTAKNKAPGRTMIGVLITDGLPNGCTTSGTYLAGLLSTHFNATAIRTFVIGMTGASFTTLETIAGGGGVASHPDFCGTAPPCKHYSVGNGDPAAFNAVLKAIQAVAIGCQYQVPTTDAGVIDPDKVTIEYTPGGTTTPQKIQRVNDASQCGPQGGWYYDNNTSPTTITLCPATCSVVQADSAPKVDISLGCLGS